MCVVFLAPPPFKPRAVFQAAYTAAFGGNHMAKHECGSSATLPQVCASLHQGLLPASTSLLGAPL